MITIKTSIYDELAAYIVIGDYSPIIAIGASLLIIIFIYLLILRPIINHLVLINVGAEASQKRHIIIRDKRYKAQEIKKMREELLKNESKKLEINLRNRVNNIIDSLVKMFNIITICVNKIYERFTSQRKSKTISARNTVKGENYEEV